MAFILTVLIISNTEGAGRKPIKPSEKDKCPVCGMLAAKYPDFLAEIVFKDGSYAVFDGPKDMFKYYFQLKKYNPSKKIEDIGSLTMIMLRRLTQHDLPRLRQLWKQNWGDEFIVAHGVTYHPDALDGFIAYDGLDWVGEITYTFMDGECEIVSLDSERERQGLGTRLINAVVEEAQKHDCRRIFLITTNDNLNALGFYQKRGFELVRINRGAVNESRKIKPGIPLIGMNNIPLRDEIELEVVLKVLK